MNAVCSRSNLTRAAACISLLATAAAVHAQSLELYVDDDAPAGGDGLSWQTAFRDLQDALDAPIMDIGRGRWVKIAAGTYKPGRGSTLRSSTFSISSGMSLYGGFAGIGHADPDEQDTRRFVSVVSGDLLGNDGPDFANRGDNAYHVITTTGTDQLLLGLTIRGGAASGSTAATQQGGGVSVELTSGWESLRLIDCVLEDNFAVVGAGLFAERGGVSIEQCRLSGNYASIEGGGARLRRGFVTRSTIAGNNSGVRGGGLSVTGTPCVISNCIFTANEAPSGGAIFRDNGPLQLANSTFFGNHAISGSCAWVSGGDRAEMWSSIFSENGQTPFASNNNFNFVLYSCIVEGGVGELVMPSGASFSAFGNMDRDPMFVDPAGFDDIPGTDDDDLRLRGASPAIDAAWYEDSIQWWIEHHPDVEGEPRLHDDPGMPNVGVRLDGILDIGAYEFQGTSCRADYDGDTVVNVPDIFAFLSDWFAQRADADFDRDRVVEVSDIFAFLAAWFAGCG